MAGIYKRNRRPRHNFPSCENRIFPFAFFNVSALLEPDQLNTCGRFAALALAAGARTAEPPAAVLLPSPSLMDPDQLNICGRFAALALADGPRTAEPPAAVLLPSPSLLEPEQLNICGNGGFCRRCCWSPNS